MKAYERLRVVSHNQQVPGSSPGGATTDNYWYFNLHIIVEVFLLMSHFVYILISPSSKSFYIGETEDIEQRLVQHNSHFFKNSYTQKYSDWEIYSRFGT